jgi:hypothetical protein
MVRSDKEVLEDFSTNGKEVIKCGKVLADFKKIERDLELVFKDEVDSEHIKASAPPILILNEEMPREEANSQLGNKGFKNIQKQQRKIIPPSL